MPILKSALTRSAPRSAIRLASSWTVIASGTTTSRTCFATGRLPCGGAFPSRERGEAQPGERARLSSSSDSARVTVSLPRWRCSSPRPRLGRAGSGRLGAGAWPPDGGRRALLPLARRGRGELRAAAAWPRPRCRASSSAARRACFGGRLFGLAVLFGAAALFLALLDLAALLAPARFLERCETRFLGLAQQLRLHFLACR